MARRGQRGGNGAVATKAPPVHDRRAAIEATKDAAAEVAARPPPPKPDAEAAAVEALNRATMERVRRCAARCDAAVTAICDEEMCDPKIALHAGTVEGPNGFVLAGIERAEVVYVPRRK